MSPSMLALAPVWFPDQYPRAHGDRHMLRLCQAKLPFASTTSHSRFVDPKFEKG